VISDNPTITYDELSEFLETPRATISRKIKKLKDSGIIKREGSDKKGKWLISEK
jgi:ATP-dependent DNA helicase RecG